MTQNKKKKGILSRLLSRDGNAPPQPASSSAIEKKLLGLEKELRKLRILTHQQSLETSTRKEPVDDKLAKLEKEVRKLGKTQFKANLLAESKVTQEADTLKSILSAQDEQSDILANLGKEQSTQTRSELLSAILPVLDGLKHARVSGESYLKKRDVAAQKIDLTSQQATLVSPVDRAMLAGWLKGLDLINERLLAILEAGDVTPIPSVGHPFDPYLHIAIGTVDKAASEFLPGIIISEERRGYRTTDKVLRFAEVIVYKPKKVEAMG